MTRRSVTENPAVRRWLQTVNRGAPTSSNIPSLEIPVVVVFIAQFVILFSGSFPAGLHSLVVGYLRWQVRTTGYLYAFTDKYPPFSLS